MSLSKRERRIRIKHRVRKVIRGDEQTPRLSVFRSNKHIAVQIIDDNAGKTMVSASSRCKEVAAEQNITKTQQAALVGKLIAQRAISKGITNVKFDRNGYLYHGRVKSLAEAARSGGLKF